MTLARQVQPMPYPQRRYRLFVRPEPISSVVVRAPS